MDQKKTLNTILFIMFIFSSPFIIFLNNFIVIPQLYKIVAVILIVVLLINNNFTINTKVSLIFIGVSIFFLLSAFLDSYYSGEILYFYIGFLTLGLIPLLFFSYPINFELLLTVAYKLAYLNLIFILISHFYFDSIGYMDFGSMACYSLVFILINFIKHRRLLDIFLVILMFALIFLFANRSAALALFVMIIYSLLFTINGKKVRAFIVSSLSLIFITVYLNFEAFLLYIVELANRMGIQSYSLIKLELALSEGILVASSGRDSILFYSLELIKMNNYFPVSYGEFKSVTGHIYPHNLLIEMIFNFGFIGVLFFVLGIICFFYNLVKLKNIWVKHFVMLLFILIFIRLQFSGSYWLETYFWFGIGILIFSTKHSMINLRRI